jgi:hypothetical protein
MHAAPSVSYPVGRTAWAGWLCALAGFAGLLAVVTWSVQSADPGWRHAAGFAAVLACGCLAARGWQGSPAGVLRWDGAAWQWEEGARAGTGRPEITLDLQSRMLLRWSADGAGTGAATRWFWLERKAKEADWDALRRAVYSRASASIPPFPRRGKEPPPAGQPPAAEQ